MKTIRNVWNKFYNIGIGVFVTFLVTFSLTNFVMLCAHLTMMGFGPAVAAVGLCLIVGLLIQNVLLKS